MTKDRPDVRAQDREATAPSEPAQPEPEAPKGPPEGNQSARAGRVNPEAAEDGSER